MKAIHYYEDNLKWDSFTKVTLSSPFIPNKIEIISPYKYQININEMRTKVHFTVSAINTFLP